MLTPLAFETVQLGLPAARLTLDRGAEAAAIAAALADGAARFVSCRIPSDWDVEAAALRACGFIEIERLVTLERDLPAEPPSDAPEVRLAGSADHDGCLAIARTAFVWDRFHRDLRLPKDRADALKAAWVANGLAGRADAPLVVREGGVVKGFNLCLLKGDLAVIDLIAVAPDARRRRYGRHLVEAAVAYFSGRAGRLQVSTQDENQPSLKLYHACGFVRRAEARTFHWLRM